MAQSQSNSLTGNHWVSIASSQIAVFHRNILFISAVIKRKLSRCKILLSQTDNPILAIGETHFQSPLQKEKADPFLGADFFVLLRFSLPTSPPPLHIHQLLLIKNSKTTPTASIPQSPSAYHPLKTPLR